MDLGAQAESEECDRKAEDGALGDTGGISWGIGICRWNSERKGREMWRKSKPVPSQAPEQEELLQGGQDQG